MRNRSFVSSDLPASSIRHSHHRYGRQFILTVSRAICSRNSLPLRHPYELVTRITRIIEWEPTVATWNRISRDICRAASYRSAPISDLVDAQPRADAWRNLFNFKNLFNSSSLALFGTHDLRAWASYCRHTRFFLK